MGKAIMFFGFVWLITCIAGGVMTGQVSGASTRLTADITATDTTIYVTTTNGFPEPGTLIIEGERIVYSGTTATSFVGNPARLVGWVNEDGQPKPDLTWKDFKDPAVEKMLNG